jgi:glycerol-3-phosphate dehydrogenase
VADVLVRRIRMAYDVADHGASAARRVAWLLGRELGWDERQKAEAVEAYERELASMDQGTG